MEAKTLFFKEVLGCAVLTLTFCMTTACGNGTNNNNATDNGANTPGNNTTVDETNNGTNGTDNTNGVKSGAKLTREKKMDIFLFNRRKNNVI